MPTFMELLRHIAQHHEEPEIEVKGVGHVQEKNMKKKILRKTTSLCLEGTWWIRAKCKWLHDWREQTSDQI